MKITGVTCRILTVLSLISFQFEGHLFAEPSTSAGHIPLLWGFSLAGAVLVSRIPFLFKKRTPRQRRAWVYWIASLLAGGLFLLVIGPIIVALGSILITGRTM